MAIDSDYNMDLASNFGVNEGDLNLVNTSEKDFYAYQKLTTGDFYSDFPNKELLPFSLKDSFTQKYTKNIKPSLDLMIAGGTHSELVYNHRCSHAFIAPLKFYIPLVEEGESYIVIDSVAGTDMAAYGLFLGVDIVIIATNLQISKVCETLQIPSFTVFNKLSAELPDAVSCLFF